MTGMLVDEIYVSSGSLRKEIKARVSAGEQQNAIWFRWKGEAPMTPVDVVLGAVLVPAMGMGGRLKFRGAVSKGLFKLLPQLQRYLAQLDPGLHPIEIEADSTADEPLSCRTRAPSSIGALFFSDISAFYTLLKNQSQIQDLIYVQSAKEGSMVSTIKTKILFKRYASVLNKNFIDLETNIERVFPTAQKRHFINHPLMSLVLGLIFNSRFARLYLPASNGLNGIDNNPILDCLKPLLQNYGTELVDYGTEVGLDEKIGVIAADGGFMDALRTCWENPYRNYNCGRCATCSRNEKAHKIVKRLGSNEYEKFASGVEYQKRPEDELRN